MTQVAFTLLDQVSYLDASEIESCTTWGLVGKGPHKEGGLTPQLLKAHHARNSLRWPQFCDRIQAYVGHRKNHL